MTGVISAVFDVFSNVSTWIVETIPTLTGMFYNAEDGLTILGTLGVASLAISVAFLLIGLIQRFFNFSAN
jgi:hypothetical protein